MVALFKEAPRPIASLRGRFRLRQAALAAFTIPWGTRRPGVSGTPGSPKAHPLRVSKSGLKLGRERGERDADLPLRGDPESWPTSRLRTAGTSAHDDNSGTFAKAYNLQAITVTILALCAPSLRLETLPNMPVSPATPDHDIFQLTFRQAYHSIFLGDQGVQLIGKST